MDIEIGAEAKDKRFNRRVAITVVVLSIFMTTASTDVLILTPAPDEPRFANTWSPIFERLAPPLRARGLTVEAASWVDADRPAARVVLPLLTWGYHLRTEGWLAETAD